MADAAEVLREDMDDTGRELLDQALAEAAAPYRKALERLVNARDDSDEETDARREARALLRRENDAGAGSTSSRDGRTEADMDAPCPECGSWDHDGDIERWYRAYEAILGMEATTPEGQSRIYHEFQAALLRREVEE